MSRGLLLDTHTFLWWRSDASQLPPASLDRIRHADLVFVSVVSAWETAIKVALGKLTIDGHFASGVEESGFAKLPISFEHAERAGTLPNHHKDPFDRMLIAQAMCDDLTLITRDHQFQAYDVEIGWD